MVHIRCKIMCMLSTCSYMYMHSTMYALDLQSIGDSSESNHKELQARYRKVIIIS